MLHSSVSVIAPVYKSLVRSVVDLIDEANATSNLPETQWHNWESRGDEDKLPRTTLIGVDGFTFRENQGRWEIRFALGVSSYRDANLLNEIDLIDFIHQRFGEGHKISLLDVEDTTGNTILSEMVVSQFEMLPMAQSEIRNYRTLGIELLRTGT